MICDGTLAINSCSTEKQLDAGLSTGPDALATDVYSSPRGWRRMRGGEAERGGPGPKQSCLLEFLIFSHPFGGG